MGKNKWILVVVVITSILLLGCEAANDIVKIAYSPDGTYTAVAFISDAGATTAFSPQVSILKNGQELGNKPGNVFRGYRSEFIDIKWENDKSLIIIHDTLESEIFKQESRKYGISISYEVNQKRQNELQ